MWRKTFDTAVADFGYAIASACRRVRAAAAFHELSLTEDAILSRLTREGHTTTAD